MKQLTTILIATLALGGVSELYAQNGNFSVSKEGGISRESVRMRLQDPNFNKKINVVDVSEKEIILTAEPTFPGGQEALFNYVEKNLEYSEEARKQEINGTMIIQFVVETDGSLSHLLLLNGLDPLLDDSAMEMIANMPKWKPALRDGKVAKVVYQLPIKFQLGEISIPSESEWNPDEGEPTGQEWMDARKK